MNEKLTYEEWRAKHTVNVPDEMKKSLKELHNIDAVEEVERAMRMEYEYYFNGGFDNV